MLQILPFCSICGRQKARKEREEERMLWCKYQWNEIKKANPEAEFKDISIILGTKWKTVTAEEKKPYEEKYQAEKESYLKVVGNEKHENEAMKLLEEEHKQRTAMELLEQYLQFKQEAEKETKKKKKEKDPLKPKQPMSAFFVFTNTRRAALVAENKSVVEVAKITGEECKNMTEKQKQPYEKIAKENKEKYQKKWVSGINQFWVSGINHPLKFWVSGLAKPVMYILAGTGMLTKCLRKSLSESNDVLVSQIQTAKFEGM